MPSAREARGTLENISIYPDQEVGPDRATNNEPSIQGTLKDISIYTDRKVSPESIDNDRARNEILTPPIPHQ